MLVLLRTLVRSRLAVASASRLLSRTKTAAVAALGVGSGGCVAVTLASSSRLLVSAETAVEEERISVQSRIGRSLPVIKLSPPDDISGQSFVSAFRLLFSDTLNYLRTLLRALQLSVIFAPLVLTSPLALYHTWFKNESDPTLLNWWFDLLVRTLERSGPVTTKLGQWAATRRDLFPAALCYRLARLQRRTAPHTWKDTHRALSEAFGGDDYCPRVLESIEHEPVGSGACAQVHRAVLADDGQAVAVKVLHPRIAEHFARDLRVLRTFATIAEQIVPSLHWLSLGESLDEFSRLMISQVDLSDEAKNLVKFGQLFGIKSQQVVFPKPLLDLCTKEVLVETFEEGEHVEEFVERTQGRQDCNPVRKEVASVGIDVLLKMIFTDNFIHGDLHPGNLLVRPVTDCSGYKKEFLQLVILDPGIVSSLSSYDLANLRAVFKAVVLGDGAAVGELFLSSSQHQCTDRPAFVRQIADVVATARSQQLTLAHTDVSLLLSELFAVLLRHRVKMESNYASVMWAVMVLEGLGRTLDPSIDLIAKAMPYLMKERITSVFTRLS